PIPTSTPTSGANSCSVRNTFLRPTHSNLHPHLRRKFMFRTEHVSAPYPFQPPPPPQAQIHVPYGTRFCALPIPTSTPTSGANSCSVRNTFLRPTHSNLHP